MCSDIFGEGTVSMKKPSSYLPPGERLSALSPSERKHFLDSFTYNKDMLVELADK